MRLAPGMPKGLRALWHDRRRHTTQNCMPQGLLAEQNITGSEQLWSHCRAVLGPSDVIKAGSRSVPGGLSTLIRSFATEEKHGPSIFGFVVAATPR
ncbi:hypothetical protein AC579_5843 [Pseudocercospora musae]|uniref:Uncharacterized protein n=1 Tax=Pseudocercospora musae TaxID=113226 RepID=A0A139ILH0_9PEZI|nr:hypothetical protein AC579_5843 [Pseudocercospora musae]KXT15646.1 hypothetical protein AC579_5843 [Pseudocercospora musae]KXT15647.1 hypothetical protein AC579_5843 [Pseudocercospora musae]